MILKKFEGPENSPSFLLAGKYIALGLAAMTAD